MDRLPPRRREVYIGHVQSADDETILVLIVCWPRAFVVDAAFERDLGQQTGVAEIGPLNDFPRPDGYRVSIWGDNVVAAQRTHPVGKSHRAS